MKSKTEKMTMRKKNSRDTTEKSNRRSSRRIS